ncbi:MAG: UDP-N-acetylmuramoyl-L-alanine--D-glutamate ligase [Paludibacteraceae bacterium]|nr:UDP-N-acetylmuramoyl-L-alanine--D-glutamate ligase [Paludibacteraceae bacterium]MBO7636883.1 UDP-N-acetylmuramoyl-L-alanine--D-glutamate ligase [Paludibacteraceae bacterium]MBR5972977.1 UDP-N-acetylmuramoyl-L-alanine--D-glutamate ligase [Paludibacteraceae bacterium]
MKRIVVLGAGESGVGAAILAKTKGFDVFVSDKSTIKDPYKKELDSYSIPWEEGMHTEEKILSANEVVKSPGIPENAPMIVALRQRSIPIISEIEFANRYTDAKMICITGSNGKTTTTMLIHHLLKEAGLNVGLAGNIGFSLARQVALEDKDYYVIELSSFQLDGMYEFKADVAVLLNITPDHLDRYEYKFQNYINSKFRIVQNMKASDYFIYWNDDPVIQKELETRHIEAKKMPFALHKAAGIAAYIENELMKINTQNRSVEIPVSSIPLRGTHNMYNSMAASITACLCNISDDNLRSSLQTFKGAEHRLEEVAKVGGVRFINDSKATNVNSCWYALQCMTEPVVLILGGKDKGNDYTEIEELVKNKVKAIVCLGVDNSKLHKFFDGMVPAIEDASSMKEAIDKCYRLASSGDTVLLSPCCASFDLFKSYEDRGTQFKECVRQL